MVVTTVWLLIGLISCDARPGTRTLRWLQSDPGVSEEEIPNSLESNEAVLPKSSAVHQSTKPIDLIPKVDGLTFLDDDDDQHDSPRVLRFYSARDPSPPTTRYVAIHSNADDGDSDGPALEPLVEGGSGVAVASSSERVSVQRIVAGVSFVGGLAASLSVCLVCCCVRRGGRRLGVSGLFRRRADDVRVDDDDVAKPEASGDVRETS